MLGPASLVLYDVPTLYFETDAGDGFRESGFSRERRLEPQITIGLLTGADGFPLMVSAFEGNMAETKTMLPVIESFVAAHQLPESRSWRTRAWCRRRTRRRSEAAGLSFILGMRIRHVPYVVAQWRREHPGEQIRDGQVFTQPWPGPTARRRDQVIYYHYRHDRARRSLRGIDEQVTKAEKAVAREGASQAQPVHPAVRRRRERESGTGGQGPGAGGGSSTPTPWSRRSRRKASSAPPWTSPTPSRCRTGTRSGISSAASSPRTPRR